MSIVSAKALTSEPTAIVWDLDGRTQLDGILRYSRQMEVSVDILSPSIEQYLQSLLPSRDEVLTEMEQIAQRKGFPIIGPLVGRLLFQLARLTEAKNIFELGSGYGYSALWFSKGIDPGGRIISTDGSNENAVAAQDFFRRAGVLSQIDFRVGDALTILDEEPGPFDIILNDIDKHQYPQAFEKAIAKLRQGGILITDNVLWKGRVVGGDSDASTAGIQRFNELAYQSSGILSTLIPLRDGVMITLKL